ncbi:MAG: long-chain fatty acid--CoA ligase [Myxococcales bacterium]|nr:MAG: long-chain fatty acid--CoA ligase [Myxococcales bacterium]
MSLNLATLLRQSAQRRPDHPALIVGSTTLTYAQLHDQAARFGAALGTLGVTAGQRVALLLPNVPAFTIAYYGALYAGASVVPLNVLLTADEIAYHLTDAQAAALVTVDALLPAALPGARQAGSVPVIAARLGEGPLPDGVLAFSDLIAAATPLDDLPATSPDDTAVILYTSGTTGRPKGAELTHFNLFHNADYMVRRLLPGDETWVSLVALPLFHSFGQTCVQNATLGLGGTLVLLPRFDPTAALELMSRHRVTFFAGVPTMYIAMLQHPDASRFDLTGLKFCVSGGSPMPVEVMRAFDAKYGVNILEGYGLSETSPVASFNVLGRPKKAGSVGLPITGCEFRLLGDDGQIVTTSGVAGEIIIKGPNVMKGYLGRPEATAEAIVDGWFRTGDVAVRDDEGYYTIVDRKKDMLIRGGFNVYPREIEEVLYQHPAVMEAAVIGVPHPTHGEEVAAIIALRPGQSVTADELIAHCKERLAAYKYPRTVEFRDSLPKTATGKILKRELRAR